MSVSLNFLTDKIEPRAIALDIPGVNDGPKRSFIVLNLGPDVTVTLSGFDLDAVESARALADTLNHAAATIEARFEKPIDLVAAGFTIVPARQSSVAIRQNRVERKETEGPPPFVTNAQDALRMHLAAKSPNPAPVSQPPAEVGGTAHLPEGEMPDDPCGQTRN